MASVDFKSCNKAPAHGGLRPPGPPTGAFAPGSHEGLSGPPTPAILVHFAPKSTPPFEILWTGLYESIPNSKKPRLTLRGGRGFADTISDLPLFAVLPHRSPNLRECDQSIIMQSSRVYP